MKYLENMFYFLFPITYLKGTPWERSWNEIEKFDFIKGIKLFFIITTIGYILHYHTVDVAEGLAPSKLWFYYRYGMALLSIFGFLFYSYSVFYNRIRFYRIPAILIMATFCYYQSRTCIWYPKVPYLYSFAFIMACVTMLKTSPLKSFIAGLAFSLICVNNLIIAKVSSSMIFSAIFFSLAVIIFSRAKYIFDVKFFLINQKNLDQQKQIIEINMEFTNQIKAFLPREISNRLIECIQKNRMGISQAIHQVLMPQKKMITCIFSDIRGFTKNANDLNGFVSEAMFPEVTACTKAIEDRRGISRKIGDLLLAYFDLDTHTDSFRSVVESAIEISKINAAFNKELPDDMRVKRFILVGAGEAIVGNLSGYSSGIEITAIGSPINQLSRIDELTKKSELSKLLISGDIVFLENMYSFFSSYGDKNDIIQISLDDLKLTIRDFEQIRKIYILRLRDFVKEYEVVA